MSVRRDLGRRCLIVRVGRLLEVRPAPCKYSIFKSGIIYETNTTSQLNDVVRTARDGLCQNAHYFVHGDSECPGIIPPDMTDQEQQALLARMSFSTKYGCELLHRKTEGRVVWFGNEAFGHVVKKSLYDILCPGWCGALDELKPPPTGGPVTLCQLTEATPYTVASQIAWVSTRVIFVILY